MALRIPQSIGLSSMLKEGYKVSQGVDEAVMRNIQAISELSQITRTSLGPNGKNKMVINHLEKLFVTSDAATIVRELEVIHPAAKMVVLASSQQEAEAGDATNFIVSFAGQLLQKAEYLLKMGLKPSEINQGYDIAGKKALEFLAEISNESVTDPFSEEQLVRAVKTSISSKQYGYEDLLAPLVAKAAVQIMPKNPTDFNVDSVRVVKILGGSINDTSVIKGMVFGRQPEGSVTKATDAKVAVFSCPLDISQTETKGTVLIHNADEMLNFSKGEEAQIEKIFQEIADSGAKVVVTGSGIGDMALHFLNRMGLLVIKVLSKFDLRRLCRVIGATPLTRLGKPMAEELGYCDIVETVEIGSDRCTVFRQDKENTRTSTIVIRGGTTNMLDDIERAIDDGINTIKAVVKDARFLPGGGATEIELSRRLMAFGEKTPGLNQYSIKKFAEAFEVIPITLAENAGMDSTEVISKLYAAHQKGETTMGVDIESENNGIIDATKAGIIDSLPIKYSALKLATNAVITVLSVDQIIMSKPAGGPKMPQQKQAIDED